MRSKAESGFYSKYELAAEAVRFSNDLSREHYILDDDNPDTTETRFETMQEVLEQGQNDCDGLALLTHQLLLDAGFPEEELYFAIIHSKSDPNFGHALTAWMGEGSNDPLFIDSTNVYTEPVFLSEDDDIKLHSLRQDGKILKQQQSFSFQNVFNHFTGRFTQQQAQQVQISSLGGPLQGVDTRIRRHDATPLPAITPMTAETLPWDLELPDNIHFDEAFAISRSRMNWMYRNAKEYNALNDPDSIQMRLDLASGEIGQILRHLNDNSKQENVFNNIAQKMDRVRRAIMLRQLVIDLGFDAEDIYITHLRSQKPTQFESTYAIYVKVDNGPDQFLSAGAQIYHDEYKTTTSIVDADILKYYDVGEMTNGTKNISTQITYNFRSPLAKPSFQPS